MFLSMVLPDQRQFTKDMLPRIQASISMNDHDDAICFKSYAKPNFRNTTALEKVPPSTPDQTTRIKQLYVLFV